MAKKVSEKKYKEWLDNVKCPVEVVLCDDMDSIRIMTIHNKNADMEYYYDVSYYDDVTGEYWCPASMYMWDVVDVLKKYNVKL